MADDNKYISTHDAVEEFSRIASGQLISFLVIRSLLADVARMNRTPEEATDYITLKRKFADHYVSSLGEPESATDALMIKNLKDSIDVMFSGITFAKAKDK